MCSGCANPDKGIVRVFVLNDIQSCQKQVFTLQFVQPHCSLNLFWDLPVTYIQSVFYDG